MPTQIVIEEIEVPNPRRIVLESYDLPHGRPRVEAAFESGGETQRKRFDLPVAPGQSRTIMHIGASPDSKPFVLKGAWRDHHSGRSGHARLMRDRFEELRRRANQVRVQWAGDTRTCMLVETVFGEEGEHDITFELHFEVLLGVRNDATRADAPAPSATTTTATTREQLGRQRDRMNRLQARAGALTQAQNAIGNAMGRLAEVERAAGEVERQTRVVGAQIRRVLSLASGAQRMMLQAQGAVRALRSETVLAVRDATNTLEFWRTQTETLAAITSVINALRDLIASFRTRVRRNVRLYMVRAGDTLESIALRTLGSAARANELGVRADDLRPGYVIRLPDAA